MDFCFYFLMVLFNLVRIERSQVASVSWGFNHIVVFVLGKDYNIWSTGFDGSFWSPWEKIDFGGVNLNKGPAVCSSAWGSLELFAGKDGNIHYKAYGNFKNGNYWVQAPTYWGCCLVSPANCITKQRGKVFVFGVGNDYSLYFKENRLYNWVNLSRPSNVRMTQDPPAAIWILNNYYVFCKGKTLDTNSNNLYYLRKDRLTWKMVSNLDNMKSGPAVIAWDQTIIHIFYRGNDDALWHQQFFVANESTDQPMSLGGTICSIPAVSSWGYGRFDVFVKGTDNKLWRISYEICNEKWNSWEKIGGVDIL